MKRIVVVDDATPIVEQMKRLLVGTGCEVLAVVVGEESLGGDSVIDLCTTDLCQISHQIVGFNPDLVFLDHDFGLGWEATGQTLAQLTGLSKEKLVGTGVGGGQLYCSQQFHGKRMLGDEFVVEDLLFLIR